MDTCWDCTMPITPRFETCGRQFPCMELIQEQQKKRKKQVAGWMRNYEYLPKLLQVVPSIYPSWAAWHHSAFLEKQCHSIHTESSWSSKLSIPKISDATCASQIDLYLLISHSKFHQFQPLPWFPSLKFPHPLVESASLRAIQALSCWIFLDFTLTEVPTWVMRCYQTHRIFYHKHTVISVYIDIYMHIYIYIS